MGLNMKQKRNLAFFKSSKEEWTNEDLVAITRFCHDIYKDRSVLPNNVFIYDDNDSQRFMNSWGGQSIRTHTIIDFDKLSRKQILLTNVETLK